MLGVLNRPSLFQRAIRAVFIDCLQPPGGYPNPDKSFQLRHPYAVLVQVGPENARHILGHVTANAAFFLGHTTAMNHAAARRPGPGNAANL